MRLGCIADDVTGATDLANNLVRGGLRVVQVMGVPEGPVPDADVVVVALKSRTAPVAQAVAQSLRAARWLREGGASALYFKVCSTFDSTPAGNIGPVTEALMDELGCATCTVVPAFPDNGRTVYQGHLFVGEQLLSDSPMRQHPLTPMTQARLLPLLQAQLSPHAGRSVGLLPLSVVRQGAQAVQKRRQQLLAEGCSLSVADTVDNADLAILAQALGQDSLMVAGSGLALGLPAAWGITPHERAQRLPASGGHQAILSGSCSAASNAQVAAFRAQGGQALALDPLAAQAEDDAVGRLLAWAATRLADGPVLIHATAEASQVKAVQDSLGVAQAGQWVEHTLAALAVGLVRDLGVRQLVVAGGETSGAVTQALGINQMRIGAQIDPGVPWCHATSPCAPQGGLHLTLKSGNFGRPDFFSHAFEALAAS